MARCSLSLQRFHLRASALDAALFQDRGLLLFERVELVEQPRGGKAERGAASPVAQTSTSRCSASSRCWMPCS